MISRPIAVVVVLVGAIVLLSILLGRSARVARTLRASEERVRVTAERAPVMIARLEGRASKTPRRHVGRPDAHRAAATSIQGNRVNVREARRAVAQGAHSQVRPEAEFALFGSTFSTKPRPKPVTPRVRRDRRRPTSGDAINRLRQVDLEACP